MKKLLVIFGITCTLAFGQTKDTKGGDFEIYTDVIGGNINSDKANFKMNAVDVIWYNNGEDIYPISTAFNSAHACYKWDNDIELIPTQAAPFSYGIYHTSESQTGDYSDDVYFANGMYKLEITDLQSEKSFYFYLDYSTDNFAWGSNSDIYVRYNVNSNSAEVRWIVSSQTYNPVNQ